jgi:hypothetical protein
MRASVFVLFSLLLLIPLALASSNLFQHYSSFTFEDWKIFYNKIYESKAVHTVQPANIVERLWINLVFKLGDFYLLVSFYFFMNFCYFLGGLLFYVCDMFQLLSSYKIQTKVASIFL